MDGLYLAAMDTRRRAAMLVCDHVHGMTFEKLAVKYRISPQRAAQIYRKTLQTAKATADMPCNLITHLVARWEHPTHGLFDDEGTAYGQYLKIRNERRDELYIAGTTKLY